MPRAFSYIRFSLPQQIKGDSLRRQTEKSVSLAKKQGWELDNTLDLRDLGVSGFRSANLKKKLGAFLQAIKDGRVKPGDVLIVESLDRLSRAQLDDAYELFRSILKTGVDIHTLEPEQHFDKTTLNDMIGLIIFLSVAFRAHEESKTKSVRIHQAWEAKRKRLLEHGERMTKKVPCWLDAETWKPIPKKVAVVKRIFRMVIEGYGLNLIVQTLTKENVAPLGRAKMWNVGTIHKFLRGRAVLGEYQPRIGSTATGQKKATDEPIKDYYPQIISEQDWYLTQEALRSRATVRGRTGESVTNLFRGLLRGLDGEPFHLTKKTTTCMVSSAAVYGRGEYLSFPYKPFENAFLDFYKELQSKDIMPDEPKNVDLDEEIAGCEAKLSYLARQVEDTQQLILDGVAVQSLSGTLQKLEQQQTDTRTKLDELQAARHTNDEDKTLAETQRAIDILRANPEDFDLRVKVRAHIRALVDSIQIVITQLTTVKKKLLLAQITFRTGRVRKIAMSWERQTKTVLVHPAQEWEAGELDRPELNHLDLRRATLPSTRSQLPQKLSRPPRR